MATWITSRNSNARADDALSLLWPSDSRSPSVTGTNTPEQKARKEITCELLFFELSAVGFLGIAAVLFKEKSMGVIRVHAILPLRKNLFLLSKLAVFLLSDLGFAVLFTLLNMGLSDGAAVLPAVLLQTAILSLVMALAVLLCALLLKDFRQFTLAYLLVAIFAVTPVFLSANTSVKFDWIDYHPFYHVYMGLKNAYFGAVGVVYIKTVMLLFIAVPILCALLGMSGPFSVICYLVPSQPAFEGIMDLSTGSGAVAVKDIAILFAHCIGWFLLYVGLSVHQR